MEGQLGPINLVVKAPNNKIEDKTVACDLSWTVLKLKEHLACVHPERPHQDQQRLVYCGKLLQDDARLKDVLRQDLMDGAHTVHLICPPRSLSQSPLSEEPVHRAQSQPYFPVSDNSDGLRRRHQLNSEPSMSESHGVASYHARMLAEQQAAYQNFMMQYNGYQGMDSVSLSSLTPQQRLWMQMYHQQRAMLAMHMQQLQFVPYSHTTASAVYTDAAQQPLTPETPPADPPAGQPQRADDGGQAMNAQGGVDADAMEGENDWLAYLYMFSRVAVLCMIIYFYSSLSRFVLILAVGAVIFVIQGGYFRIQRRQPPRAAPVNIQHAAPNMAENQNNHIPERNASAETVLRPPAPRGLLTTSLTTVFLFITTFFSSLIPQNPEAVNVN